MIELLLHQMNEVFHFSIINKLQNRKVGLWKFIQYSLWKKNKKIRLVYGGTELTNEQKKEIISKAKDFQLENTKIQIEQGLTFNEGDEATDQALKLKDQISRLSAALRDREADIDSIKVSNELGGLLLKELNSLFPQITSCGFTETFIFKKSSKKPQKQSVIMISLSSPLKNGEKEKLNGFLKERLKSENIKVIYDPIGDWPKYCKKIFNKSNPYNLSVFLIITNNYFERTQIQLFF